MSDMPETFKNVIAVLRYLQGAGYKIAKSKIYEDKKAGLLRVQAGGSVLGSDVALYAGTLKPVAGTEGLDENHALKLEKEVERLDLQNKRLLFEFEKEQKKYIPKRDFEMEMAARASVLEVGFRHMFQANVSEWVALVGGEALKANALLERLYRDFERHIHAFANTEKFQILIVEEEQ